jgi:o-succinylbenzoate---CoA ligase
MIVPNWLSHRAEVSDQIALEFEQKIWTYAEMEVAAVQLACNLAELGINQGDRVGILMENDQNYIFLIHALTKLGCIAVLLNIRLSVKELHWQLRDSAVNLLLCDRALQAKAIKISQESPSNPIKSIELESCQSAQDSQASNKQDLKLISDIDLEAVQAIIYTSGTTGTPKGVQLTYSNHFHSAIASGLSLGTNATEHWLVCLPLFHVGGLSMIWRSLIDGATLTLLPRFDLNLVNGAIATGKITRISLVPTMLHRLLDSIDVDDFSGQMENLPKLRGILVGGATMSQQLLERCLKLRLPIMPTYGMTEAASQIATLRLQDLERKQGSVGQPLACNQIKISSSDRPDIELPSGGIGQIWIKGLNVMLGYVNTLERWQDRWFPTGDLGYVDHEGFLYVVNRRTDLIISGGENIYPAELEAILEQHPAIQDICVVGQSDREWGQIVVAVVVATELLTLSEIRDFCLKHDLTRYKLPKVIHLADHLPKTVSGKIARLQVLELLKNN